MNVQSVLTEIPAVAPDITVEVLEFFPKHALRKTIVSKKNADISVRFFEETERIERTCVFDTFLQIIEGSAEIIIKDKKYKLLLGEGIIVPANVTYHFASAKKFKVVFSVITEVH